MSETLLTRFLRYVQIDTQSDEASKTCLSMPSQLVLLEMLKQELVAMGAGEVKMTKHGYFMATLPATTRKPDVQTDKCQFSLLTLPGRAGGGPLCRASCALSVLGPCITS